MPQCVLSWSRGREDRSDRRDQSRRPRRSSGGGDDETGGPQGGPEQLLELAAPVRGVEGRKSLERGQKEGGPVGRPLVLRVTTEREVGALVKGVSQSRGEGVKDVRAVR